MKEVPRLTFLSALRDYEHISERAADFQHRGSTVHCAYFTWAGPEHLVDVAAIEIRDARTDGDRVRYFVNPDRPTP